MSASKARKNPFYVALVIVGVVFLITAILYGVMAYRAVQGLTAEESGSRLLMFIDRHGAWLMAGELVALLLASAAAMATDRFWTKS